MSALFVSLVQVRDQDKFQEYLAKSKMLAGQHGAELLVRGKFEARLADISPDHDLLVIARFPTSEALRTWYDSADYQALIPLREAGSRQFLTAYEALDA